MSLWQFTQATRGWLRAHVPRPEGALDRAEIANLEGLLTMDAERGEAA
jgi:hypothetical protein